MRKGIDIIKQLKEKLGKSADAGDYIDDFKKSDAPQFKGKSDKKKEKMAVAAYLDSKEEVKEAVAQNDAFVVTGGPGDNAQKVIAVFKDKGNGLKDAKKARDDYDKKNKPTKKSHFARIYRQTRLSQAGQRLKPGEKIMYSTFGNKQQFTKVKEEVDLEEARLPSFKDLVKYKYGDDHAGAIHFSKIGGKEYHWNYLDRKGGQYSISTKKTGEIRVSRAGADSKINKVVKEETDMQESGHTDVASMKTQVQIATDALQKMNTELGKLSDEEDLPTWWTNKVATAVSKLDGMADYIDAKQDMGKTMTEEYKSLNESAIGCLQTAMIDNNKSLKKESKMGELFLDMQMDAQEMDEREFIKVYTKKGFQAAELKSLYKEFSEEVVKEVVDNSLMSQATRVISQTAIQEKIDPADVDNVATSGDRKAADKNIVFQLRRAQDMIKQTGRQDQTGVTFKDNPKKKEKIDIKVINKVLDMFDSLRPNDKAKMQTTIGKSYRDLLKTVQRGR